MGRVIATLPPLYGLSSNNKIKTIIYTVEDMGGGAYDIVNTHGYVDGKKQVDRRTISAGKNIGKSNETTAKEQALLEIKSKWDKKLDSNYTTNENGIPGKEEKSLLPMLAHTFQKRKHNIEYPCLVQPKLDGVRSMATICYESILFTSRKFKPYNTLDHLKNDILSVITENNIIDGEIYKHGLTLEEINRRVKKYRKGLTEELEFWIFDLVSDDVDADRQDKIDEYFSKYKGNYGDLKVVRVPTFICNSEEEVKTYHDKFVQEGFEGVIIRNRKGEYLLEKRSKDLQKYKEFFDAEFEIIGAYSGDGRETGAIIFKCRTEDGKVFDVRPRGSIEMRKEWMSDAGSYIGKKLTVRYQSFTENNIPQFPVGIAVRLDEDI